MSIKWGVSISSLSFFLANRKWKHFELLLKSEWDGKVQSAYFYSVCEWEGTSIMYALLKYIQYNIKIFISLGVIYWFDMIFTFIQEREREKKKINPSISTFVKWEHSKPHWWRWWDMLQQKKYVYEKRKTEKVIIVNCSCQQHTSDWQLTFQNIFRLSGQLMPPFFQVKMFSRFHL